MFSATGNLLSGSPTRPEILTWYACFKGMENVPGMGYGYVERTSQERYTLCTLNNLGHIPIVSTFSGIGRILLAIVHTIVHLVCAIFDAANRDAHLAEAYLGLKHIARGGLELIPFLNIITIWLDGGREELYYCQMRRNMGGQGDWYDNFYTLAINGEIKGQRAYREVKDAIAALGREPTAEDMYRIILNRA